MNPAIPIQIIPPKCWDHTLDQSGILPDGLQYALAFTKTYQTRWGKEKQNFIVQQVYGGSEILYVHLTIKVDKYTRLAIKCVKPLNVLQYTLSGNLFSFLKGHGCLPLFENTYTLVYVPEGMHYMVLPPGIYHYCYILPGPSLNALSGYAPNIAEMVKYMEASHEDGKMAIRLPMDKRVKNLLNRLIALPKMDAEAALTLPAIVLKLLRHCMRQIKKSDINPDFFDLPAEINTLIAENIRLPVPQILILIKKQFFIGDKTLLEKWKKVNAENLRKYIKDMRALKVLYLLSIEGYSVTKAAGHLNYYDAVSLVKQFRDSFQCTTKTALDMIDS